MEGSEFISSTGLITRKVGGCPLAVNVIMLSLRSVHMWYLRCCAIRVYLCTLLHVYYISIKQLYTCYNSIKLLKVKSISIRVTVVMSEHLLLWGHFRVSSNEFCTCLVICFKADNVIPFKMWGKISLATFLIIW